MKLLAILAVPMMIGVSCRSAPETSPASVWATGPFCFSTPSRPSERRRASAPDSLLAPGTGQLVIDVDSSTSDQPLREVHVGVLVPGRPISLYTDSAGRAVLDSVPAGRYRAMIRRIAFEQWQDTLEVRAGFVDTVSLGLGWARMCLQGDARGGRHRREAAI